MLFIISLKSFLRSPSSRSVSAMLNACRVSPSHEVRPWSYHTVDSVYSLRGKARNHFQLLVIELLLGSHGRVVLSPAWKTILVLVMYLRVATVITFGNKLLPFACKFKVCYFCFDTTKSCYYFT